MHKPFLSQAMQGGSRRQVGVESKPATRSDLSQSGGQGVLQLRSARGARMAVVVDEPLHLFGENTAPAPGEIVLSALGGCLAVGITAVATWKQVKLSKLWQFSASC
jgi:hypothetical protein